MKKKAISIVVAIVVFAAIALVYVKRAKYVEAERNLPAKSQEPARIKTHTVAVGEVKEYLFAIPPG